MGLLSRDDILSADDIRYEVVPVEEWGGEIRIKTLTGAELDALQASTIRRKGPDTETNLRGFRARLVALAAVDGNGKRLFTERDVQALGAKSGVALNRVVEAVNKLSGIGEEEVKEMTEGFDDAPSEDATSA